MTCGYFLAFSLGLVSWLETANVQLISIFELFWFTLYRKSISPPYTFRHRPSSRIRALNHSHSADLDAIPAKHMHSTSVIVTWDHTQLVSDISIDFLSTIVTVEHASQRGLQYVSDNANTKTLRSLILYSKSQSTVRHTIHLLATSGKYHTIAIEMGWWSWDIRMETHSLEVAGCGCAKVPQSHNIKISQSFDGQQWPGMC